MTAAANSNQRVSARATGIVGIAILCSRLLGLLREVIFAALFGASRNMDAFLTAFRAPNMLRDLFAEGALSTAFVTTFSRRIATDGDASAWRLASKVATLTVVFMSALTVLGILFAPALIQVLAPGFPAEKAVLTIQLTRVMFPFILLVSLAALVMGMLNAKNVFGMPAMASSFFNIGSIVGGVVLCYWLEPQADWRHPHFGERGLMGLAIATLIGGLLQLVVQLPSLGRVGFHFRPDFNWRDPGVRTVLALMGPATIAASAVQVNVLINSVFASKLGDGPIAWLNIAFRLMQLPLGIFGVAIATVTLPLISRSAALGNKSEFRGALAHALRLVMLLTVPSAIGLVILAKPIIALIYQHGRFTAEATTHTAEALQFYAIGLVGYSAIKVLAPAFYALDKRNLPMFVSLFSIALNAGLNWFFTLNLGLGHRGLALSTSLVAITNFLVLYAMMRRYAGRLETGAMVKTLAKLLVAGAFLAGICFLAQQFIFIPSVAADTWQRLFGIVVTIAVGGGAFFGVAYLLHIAELRDVVTLVRGRLSRLRS
ncbi:MAG: murein biosynthesis integral membrane protein MurJ [Verrucomicrobia bacterium]|nr:MAG: murein biosynthesis integral membrane protein MurJ [Verrucomicrobiota bacterium]